MSLLLRTFAMADRVCVSPQKTIAAAEGTKPEEFGPWARYVLSADNMASMMSRAKRCLKFHQQGAQIEIERGQNLFKWSYCLRA